MGKDGDADGELRYGFQSHSLEGKMTDPRKMMKLVLTIQRSQVQKKFAGLSWYRYQREIRQ